MVVGLGLDWLTRLSSFWLVWIEDGIWDWLRLVWIGGRFGNLDIEVSL